MRDDLDRLDGESRSVRDSSSKSGVGSEVSDAGRSKEGSRGEGGRRGSSRPDEGQAGLLDDEVSDTLVVGVADISVVSFIDDVDGGVDSAGEGSGLR